MELMLLKIFVLFVLVVGLYIGTNLLLCKDTFVKMLGVLNIVPAIACTIYTFVAL